MCDLVIRGGLVVDGSGSAPFRGDVAVSGDRIVAVGDLKNIRAAKEIDAHDCIVTPGFVDVHTHYDGQAIWSSSLSPSSMHGVTTVITGNCGVGFAPCRTDDRALLVSVMEGVEDIPEVVMTAGLPWNWETFPEFLDAIDSRPHDIDIATYVPHSALRVYVMGERGAAREPATVDDLQQMSALMEEALDAGALGFATGSVPIHRTSAGDYIPTFGAAEAELQAIATTIRRKGFGIMQVLVDLASGPVAPGINLLQRLAETSGQLVTFSLSQLDSQPDGWREVLARLTEANAQPGVNLKAQVFPRPVGVLLGHELTLNPFRLCPTYDAIADLPLPEKLAILRQPDMRARLLQEVPADPTQPLFLMGRNFARMFPLGTQPDYEPPLSQSVAARAEAAGVSPEEIAYDLLLEDDGKALLYVAIANYAEGSLDPVLEMMRHPDCVLGLGDGGAHYGLVCDASFPTYVLTHWVRDRDGSRIPLPVAIRALSQEPAEAFGLRDRGCLAAGYRADVNIIDPAHLTLHRPHVVHDLPSNGRRIMQSASGIRATMVAGQITWQDGQPTGALPGRLIRGARPMPVAQG